MVQKMNYGEDVSCCVNKLYLASKLINRLDCYCFDAVPVGKELVMSQLGLTETNTTYLVGSTGQLIINGVQVVGITAEDTFSEKSGIEFLLTLANLEYTSTSGGGNYTINVTAEPTVTSITVVLVNSFGEISVHDFKLNVAGVPIETSCHNCISDSDLPKMYALLNTLLQ
jgi:hypothetical protein